MTLPHPTSYLPWILLSTCPRSWLVSTLLSRPRVDSATPCILHPPLCIVHPTSRCVHALSHRGGSLTSQLSSSRHPSTPSRPLPLRSPHAASPMPTRQRFAPTCAGTSPSRTPITCLRPLLTHPSTSTHGGSQGNRRSSRDGSVQWHRWEDVFPLPHFCFQHPPYASVASAGGGRPG